MWVKAAGFASHVVTKSGLPMISDLETAVECELRAVLAMLLMVCAGCKPCALRYSGTQQA